MGFIEKLQAKIELYRLEQRYARRKHRSTFSGVQYVDGEYVYSNGSNSPTGTVSKHSTGSYWKTPTWGGSGSESRWRWWTNLTLFHFLSLLPTGPLYILGIMFMRRIWWRFRSHMNACYSIFSRSFMGTDGPSRSDIEDMRPHFPIVICDHFTSKVKRTWSLLLNDLTLSRSINGLPTISAWSSFPFPPWEIWLEWCDNFRTLHFLLHCR